MNEQDIRWEQRFRNYIRALRRLEDSVNYISRLDPYVDSEKQHGEVNDVLNDLIDHIHRIGVVFYEKPVNGQKQQ
jgi:hypothetical protein